MADCAHLRRRLQALDFAQWKTVDCTRYRQFQTLVLWLEETKIRLYDVAERKGLRSFSRNWDAEFVKYLKAADCPRPFHERLSAKEKIDIADWLISLAVDLACEDAADNDKFGFDGMKDELRTAVYPAQESPSANDSSTTQHQKLLVPARDVADKLGLNSEGSLEEVLERILVHVQRTSSRDGKQVKLEDIPDEFPVGFELEGYPMDRAASILRMLFINDLRSVQTAVNECVAKMQEITAQPRTDSARGRVGR